MNLLLIVALVLAWPTYGISIAVWLVAFFLKPLSKTDKVTMRREVVAQIEPLFNEQHAAIFNTLDVPLKSDLIAVPDADAHQCGRHIMNYIAQNRDELQSFIIAMKRWPRREGQLCRPLDIINIEKSIGDYQGIYAVAIRAVESIIRNNPGIHSFRFVDISALRTKHSDIIA